MSVYAGQAMTETILGEIKAQFALLLTNVRLAIQNNKAAVANVRQFLVAFFGPGCERSIPDVPDITKIFNAITDANLWHYDDYIALEKVANAFLPEGSPERALVMKYKGQLNGFYATTRIIDIIKLNELEDNEDKSTFSAKKYVSHHQKLTVALQLKKDNTSFLEMTLEYVDKLWNALMEEFQLPPLTAILDKIVEGSLRITWLILPHIVEKIRAVYMKSVEFFQQQRIIEIHIEHDNVISLSLYDEEWMVSVL